MTTTADRYFAELARKARGHTQPCERCGEPAPRRSRWCRDCYSKITDGADIRGDVMDRFASS